MLSAVRFPNTAQDHQMALSPQQGTLISASVEFLTWAHRSLVGTMPRAGSMLGERRIIKGCSFSLLLGDFNVVTVYQHLRRLCL